jgi:hypothetical protein
MGKAAGSASIPGTSTSGPGYGQQPTFTPPPGTYGTPAGGPPTPGVYGTPAGGPPAASSSSYSGSYSPPPYAGPDQSNFANLRYDDGPTSAPPAKSKRGLIIGVVIATVVVLTLAGAGVTWFLSNNGGSANDFAVNSCVKKSDTKAVSVSCSTDDAYQIVSKVETVDRCQDKNQPFVVLQETGKPDQVLCLKPAK